MRFLILSAALAAAAAQADTYTQTPYPLSADQIVTSQNFPDIPGSSAYSFDDFNVTGGGWQLSQVVVYGAEGGLPTQTTGTHLRIVSNASWTNPGTVSVQVDTGLVQVGNDQVFNGLATTLAPGHYWLQCWIDRRYDTGGQWFWDGCSDPGPIGQLAMAQNPGGDWGFGTDPITVNSQVAGIKDLAFSITYTAVPEPATVLAIGLGLFCLSLRRRT